MPLTIDFDLVKKLAAELVNEHYARHRVAPPVIVALGGSAMAAYNMRQTSADADFYMPELDDDAVAAVVARHRHALSDEFKMDVTPANSTWGKIALRDIDQSPVVAVIETVAGPIALRALAPEDLFLLKVSAGREKDVQDLPRIAEKTTLGGVMARANKVIPWFGDRSALPDFLVRLIRDAARCFKMPEAAIEAALAMPDVIRRRVAQLRASAERRARLLAQATEKPRGSGET